MKEPLEAPFELALSLLANSGKDERKKISACDHKGRRKAWVQPLTLFQDVHLRTPFGLLSLIHTVTEVNKLDIQLLKSLTDTLFSCLANLLLDQTSSEGTEDLVENVVLGPTDRKVELVHLGLDLLDGEHVLGPTTLGRRSRLQVDGHAEPVTAEEDVGGACVLDLGKPALLVKVELDVAHVRLDLCERDLEAVGVYVSHLGVLRHFEVVTSVDLEDVGHQVLALHREVLDHEVDHLVGVLDTGDGDVSDVLEQLRKDRVADVRPEVGLELGVALRVQEEVLGKALPVLAELLVQGVLAHTSEEGLDLLEQTVLVRHILALVTAFGSDKELLAGLGELTSLRVGLILHDEAGLLEHATDVGVEALEPVLELGVVLGVGVDLVERIKHGLGATAVGETLDKATERALGGSDVTFATDPTGVLLDLTVDVGGVTLVLLERGEEVLHRVLVVAVTLAFDDDLLEAEDELVTTLLGELFLDVVLGLVEMLLGEILVLLRDLVLQLLKLVASDIGDASLVLLCREVGVSGVDNVVGVTCTSQIGNTTR